MAEALRALGQEAHLLFLGMLVGVSDECLCLARFFDKEALKLEDLPEQIASFSRGTWSV